MYKTCRVHKEQICGVATTRYVLHIPNSACTLQLWHVQEKLHCYTWQYSRGYIPTSASGETGIQKSHAWSQKIPAYNNCLRGVWSAGVLKHSEIFKTSLFNIFLPQRETRRTTHTHPSCLASKGKISSFLWSGYTCASLAYWVSQKAILISDHYFFYIGGRTKEFLLHTTEKHFKILHTAASWCFQIFFTAFLHCKYIFCRSCLSSDTQAALRRERGRGRRCGKAAVWPSGPAAQGGHKEENWGSKESECPSTKICRGKDT